MTAKIAPEFTLFDQSNTPVSLSQFKGKWVVIYFYPKDDTPGCTREGIGFSERKEAFEAKNAVILGVSKDSTSSHLAFCQKYNLAITLLSDPDTHMIAAYDAWKEKSNYGKTYMGIVRTTVLIDPDGVISKQWNNVRVDGHVDAVFDAIPTPSSPA
jgi:peroxiredoxin Q/BCP